jgi:hypothetical protein
MFWKYLEPLFEPFRKGKNKIRDVQNQKGKVQMDVKRAQQNVKLGQNKVNAAKDKLGGAQQQAAGAAGAMQNAAGGAAGAAGGQFPGGINPNPPIMTKGALFWKKKICTQCENELDKTWDACPYCAQAAQEAAAANAPKAPMKTQAFMINPGGGGASTMQLLGWIVPLQGSQRGELFTLTPASSIGTDPGCTVVLHDKFMSSKHAEIKAEGGVWVLKDLGSTNGTYVNDKRVDKHELVDNDFIKFGGSLVKFKSL